MSVNTLLQVWAQVSGGVIPGWWQKFLLCRWGPPSVVIVQFAHVFLQVEVPAEALSAGGAGEGLLVVVGVHVEGQVVDLVERLVTNIALELFLPAVSELVILVIP